MTRTSAKALAVARPVVLVLMFLNVFAALAMAGALIFSFFIEGWPIRPLGLDMVTEHPRVGDGLRAIVAVLIVGAALVHSVLQRLLAIVDTVRVGNPFILENARRLEGIAWLVVASEGLRLAVAAIAAATWESGRVPAFAIAPWVTVLLLFVLAGVFAHGAAMREDLEGTV